MPLAYTGGGVASGLQLFGERNFLEGEKLLPFWNLQFRMGAFVAGDPIGKV